MEEQLITFLISFFIAGSIIGSMMLHTHIVIKNAHRDYKKAKDDLESSKNNIINILSASLLAISQSDKLTKHDKDEVERNKVKMYQSIPLGVKLNIYHETIQDINNSGNHFDLEPKTLMMAIQKYIQTRLLLQNIANFINNKAFLKSDQVETPELNDHININIQIKQ